jgi:purine-nucleoside phosphorylase
MFKKLGADVVGMSVVPEAIVANQQKMKVLAIAYVSNLAAGLTKKMLSHKEVLEIAERVKDKLGRLIKGIVKEI